MAAPITLEAHMIASILAAILPTVGKIVDLGFGSEAKYKIFCRKKRVAIEKNPQRIAEEGPVGLILLMDHHRLVGLVKWQKTDVLRLN